MPILEYPGNVKDVEDYIDGENEADMLRDLETLVHEGFHTYETSIGNRGSLDNGYFLGEGIEIAVEVGEVFYTPEMDASIPANLKDEDFNSRYDPYVVGDLRISAHTQGIYGLMEEMNAYWLGAHTTAQIWPLLLEKAGTDHNSLHIQTGLVGVGGNLLARYQFRYFLAWYLDFAERKHPKVYQSIMANKRLRLVYTLLEIRFEEIEWAYQQLLQDAIQVGESGGYEGFLEDNWLCYKKGGGRQCRGTYLDEMADLDKAFPDALRARLEAFQLKGANLNNWKEYL